ncbi:MAG: SH3 domain-containing protein [Clostridia bacterium]|nr:SH3 domain-containing protein [Clostridia bacterium]
MTIKRISVAFILWVLTSFLTIASAVEYPCEGVANALNVRVRKTASTQAKQVATLDKKEIVTVLGEQTKKNGDIWYQVETAKGKSGYVLSDYLSIPETEHILMDQESADAVLMHVKVRVSCGDYNGVGKKWTHYHEWNGIQVADGESEGYIAPDVELSIYSRIREQDSKPDTAMEKMNYVPTTEDAVNGFVLTQTLKVVENAGKYKGEAAIWKVEFTFTPVPENENALTDE